MMRKTKAKRGAFWQTQMLPFVIVWAISVGFVGVLSRLWQIIPIPFLYNLPEEQVTLSLIISVIGTGLAQVFLVERLLKKSMRGWMFYTVPSILITVLANRFLGTWLWRVEINSYLYPYIGALGYSLIRTLALNVPTSLLQFFWLRRRVERAWLWPLMTIPLLLAFTAIPYGVSDYRLLKIVILLSVGVVQAGLMHYLWQHPKDSENVKINSDSDELPNHLVEFERLDRLQERERNAQPWDHDDHQALQSEA